MRAIDIIEKKRDKKALTQEEIDWFIAHYTNDDIPDYQVAAFLMAVLLNGMTTDEVTHLTMAMAKSGDMLDLSEVSNYVVDKHSSGGVGDKTSLVVLPLVAASGVPVAKMSGRGLGLSGGTLDKLEAIAGFRFDLDHNTLIRQAKTIGLALAGQTKNLAPADGKLYALRDVTGTVPSIPLIASSIMSKKLASGANGIVLDVKVGSGAFMNDLSQARELAETMVAIGKLAGRDMIALLSDMNQPLGFAVGNALEVEEAVLTLKGGGPDDFRKHCIEVAAYMLSLAKPQTSLAEHHAAVTRLLDDGGAYQKFRQMVEAQGGDVQMIDDPTLLPQAKIIEQVHAEETGFIQRVDAKNIARAAFELGAGREKKEDSIDPAVGVKIHVKVGQYVEAGAPLATIYANDAQKVQVSRDYIRQGVGFSQESVDPLPLFYDVIGLEK
ncbi:MAG: thymidine phosphorylase [Phototrophicales bacterium]|nr:MAG: thymidine phosphorylase [Phototrophicales bacterium]